MGNSRANARSLSELLRGGHGPEQLLVRARAHARLQRHLQTMLPEDLAAHARVACVREKTLVMAADSPAWATRLRVYNNELLAAARTAWPGEIGKLKVIVAQSDPGVTG